MSRKSLLLSFVPKEEELENFSEETFCKKRDCILKVINMFFGEQGEKFLQAQFGEKPVFKIFIPRNKALVLGKVINVFTKNISEETDLIVYKKTG